MKIKPRKPIARVSPRRTNQMAQYAKVKARFLDQNPYCFRCNENVPLMFRTVHHFYGRVHALLIWVPGFRTACMRCHNWIENNRNDSVRLGFRAPNNLWNRPSIVIPR